MYYHLNILKQLAIDCITEKPNDKPYLCECLNIMLDNIFNEIDENLMREKITNLQAFIYKNEFTHFVNRLQRIEKSYSENINLPI